MVHILEASNQIFYNIDEIGKVWIGVEVQMLFNWLPQAIFET